MVIMPRLEADTQGDAWDHLRAALSRLDAIAASPRADLVALGKAYAALAEAMREVALAAGQSSARFDAAARALDLRTPKSAIEAFVAD
jgi:hypothetical protein